jgi:SAM-dependent methyltransferase
VGAAMADGGDLEVSEERLTEHAEANREAWAREAENYVAGAERNWAAEEITWGILDVPESEVQMLGDVAGKDVVELGCGTAYVSAWLARRGARVVGVDLTEEQLATARRMQGEHALDFPLIHASAEDVPLPDASFDLAVSEYGASIWCDPDLWIAEAARLLRPGGELVFLVNGTLVMLTGPDTDPVAPAGTELLRPYFGMRRFEWVDDTSVDFHLGYGDWIRVLTSHGFEVERLVELRNPGHGAGRYDLFSAEWAERWPAEEMWKARKVA